MVVCFEKQLTAEWYRIAKYVRDLGHRLLGKKSIYACFYYLYDFMFV